MGEQALRGVGAPIQAPAEVGGSHRSGRRGSHQVHSSGRPGSLAAASRARRAEATAAACHAEVG